MTWFDNFCVLLKGEGRPPQLVYKHAISTIAPNALDLCDDSERTERMTLYDPGNDVSRRERAVVVVPERVGEGARRSTEARLEEAEGLRRNRPGRGGAKAFRVRQLTRRPISARASSMRLRSLRGKRRHAVHRRRALDAGAAAKSLEEQVKLEGHRPHRPDPRNLRRAGAHRRRPAAGRDGASRYQPARLVRTWTHLERQRGGFGFLGGPGETQLETDRRLLRDRMARFKRELDQVKRHACAAARDGASARPGR